MHLRVVRLLLGDSLVRLQDFPDESVDDVVCDPPYDLIATTRSMRVDPTKPTPRGFMGKTWDGTGIAFSAEFWREVHRVLRSGGRVKVFGGTRTFHRVARTLDVVGLTVCGIEPWGQSQGFPKSLDVSKAIDSLKGAERKVIGFKRGVKGAEGTGWEKAMPGKAVGIKQVAVDVPITAPATPEAALWDGWGTALKPSWEPVLVARKPQPG